MVYHKCRLVWTWISPLEPVKHWLPARKFFGDNLTEINPARKQRFLNARQTWRDSTVFRPFHVCGGVRLEVDWLSLKMRRWPYKLSLVGLKLQTRRTSPCFISSNSRELALQTLEQHETFSNLSFASKKVQALEEIALQCWDTHTPWAISHFPQLPGFFSVSNSWSCPSEQLWSTNR